MTDEIEQLISTVGQKARVAATRVAAAETAQKNLALEKIAEAVDESRETILAANAKDLELARSNNLADALYDRLELNDARVDGMISGCARSRSWQILSASSVSRNINLPVY